MRTAIIVAVLLIIAAGHLARDALAHADLVSPRGTDIVYDRNGAFLTQIGDKKSDDKIDYGYWPLAQIPSRAARATLALEDRRFDAHPGIDIRAVLRAAWRNTTSHNRTEGASTIAMQVARMQQPAPRHFVSKIQEAATALAIVAKNGHQATLAQYLRLAPYGNGSHGVAHAARYYFDRSVEDLSWAQTALLVAIPQSPGRMNITRESGLSRAVQRAHYAIARLVDDRALDVTQASLAHRELDAMRPLGPRRRPDMLHLALRYERLTRAGLVRPLSEHDRRIESTIDLAVERDVAQLARRYLSNFKGLGARQVAVMVMERGTNAIVADVGSADYLSAAAGAFDFTRVMRSPGSTLKPFVYALALERGLLKSTDLLNDAPEGASGVSNADGQFLGLMTPRQALANSRNVPATNLLRRVGLEANFSFLRELGLHDLQQPGSDFGIAMAIGALPTRLEDLMRAYAAIADDGVMRELSFARNEEEHLPRRVMSLDTARLITSYLSDPQARLPSFPRYGALEYPFAVAVKTGTSQAYRDAWTLAYSHKYVVGVWMGRGDAGAMRAMSGVSSAARLAHAALVKLHNTKPGEIGPNSFAPAPDRVAIDLCRADAGADCAQTLREWVKPEEARLISTIAPSTNIHTAAVTLNADAPAPVIATPEPNMHVWRNPEQPAALNKLALKVEPMAQDTQIVWMIDGQPFAVAQAYETVFWPMASGSHRIEARLALASGASASVRIIVE